MYSKGRVTLSSTSQPLSHPLHTGLLVTPVGPERAIFELQLLYYKNNIARPLGGSRSKQTNKQKTTTATKTPHTRWIINGSHTVIEQCWVSTRVPNIYGVRVVVQSWVFTSESFPEQNIKVLCPKESGNISLFERSKALLNYFLINKGESEQHTCQLKKWRSYYQIRLSSIHRRTKHRYPATGKAASSMNRWDAKSIIFTGC